MMNELKAILNLLGIEFDIYRDKVVGERIETEKWDVIVWCGFDRDELELCNHETDATIQGLRNIVKEIIEIEK